MIEHIVRINEKTEDILSAYHITLDELKENNLHITDFNKLPCGLKLRIPYLSKETEQILESTEGFVLQYYPEVEEISSTDILKDIRDVEQKDEEKPSDIGIVRAYAADNNSSFRNIQNAYPGITPPRKPYMGNRNR